MLSLSKEQIRKSSALINDVVEEAFVGLLTDVETSLLKKLNATLSSDELRSVAAQVDILRQLKTYKKALINGNRDSAV